MNKVVQVILATLIAFAILLALIVIIHFGMILLENNSNDYHYFDNIKDITLGELFSVEPQTPKEKILNFFKKNYQFIITDILLIIVIVKVNKLKKIKS